MVKRKSALHSRGLKIRGRRSEPMSFRPLLIHGISENVLRHDILSHKFCQRMHIISIVDLTYMCMHSVDADLQLVRNSFLTLPL